MSSKLKLIAIAITSIPAIAAIVYHSFDLNNNSSETNEKGPGMAPGWVEQWRTMKGLKEGESVPFGLYSQWQKADNAAANKRRVGTGLFNLKELGPYNIGGRTRDMIIDKANPERILACGISGGIWESKNNGKDWKPINDLASSLSATSIDQSPFEHNVIYYGTGEGSGNSAGIPGEGVFKSNDGGQTFEQLESTLNDNFTYTWDVKHSLVDSNTVFVSTPNRGLWRTTNAGDTFERVYVSAADIHDIEVFKDSTILIAVESVGIFKSKTGDLGSWEKLTDGLPTGGFNRIDITYSDSFPNVVYALFAEGLNGYNGSAVGVYKSSNGGESWTFQGNPQTGTNESFGFPWYCLALGVDPLDTNKLVAGSAGYTYTLDGGKTWRRGRNSHADYHVFKFRPDRQGYFYAGNDGGIYEYNWETVGSQFVDKNEGYNVTQIYAGTFTPDTLGTLIGSQDNWSKYAHQGRPDFRQVYGGDGSFCHIHQQNPNIAYMSSQNANLRKTGALTSSSPSTISAITSNVQADGVWFINPFEMNYLDGDMLFFPSRRGLWMSFDGAQFWTQIVDRKSNMYAVGIPYVENPQRVYLGGDNLQLFRVEDPINATTGNEVSLRKNLPDNLNNGFIACITVHPRDDGTLYLTMSNYSNAPKVLRVDSAHTDNPVWTDISGDLPQGLPANWIEVDPYRPDDFLVVATDFGLYTTSNGGENWVKEERIPNVSIHNIRMRYTDRKLFVFTHGRGGWAMNLQKMEDPFVGIENEKSVDLNLYPNPTQSILNVELNSTFEYEILNIEGRTLLSGKSSKSIDVSTLAKGNYILKANTESQNFTSRFVKQ